MSLDRAARDSVGYLIRVVILAASYYLMGKLGLLLAVPPGFATIIWPPSGISLAVLLAYGPRLWPGIFLGSFVLNAQIAGALSWPEGLALRPVAIAFCIAAGSTLQALLARVIAHRVMGRPIALKNWTDVVLFLLLVGPVGCLVAPTIAVTTLYLLGSLSPDAVVQNWLTWWKGDAFGMLVFLPLMLIVPGSSRAVRWRDKHISSLPAIAFVALLVPLGLTFYAWKAVARVNHDKRAAQFLALSREGEKALLYRIESFTQALYGAVGFIQGSSYVTRAEWRAYSRALDVHRNYPGMIGIGWISNVKPEEIQDFVERMRAEGDPGFTIHPGPEARGNFVVSYIEPELRNRPSIGLNIAAEEHRYRAAIAARDTGLPTITRRIQLAQDRSGDAGFLLMLPLYDANMPKTSLDERRTAIRGWVFTPLIGKTFLAGLTHRLGSTLNLHVYDGMERPEHQIFASHGGEEPRTPPIFQVRETLQVGHRPWVLVWESTPAFEKQAASLEPLLVLFGGLVLTALFGGFLMVITRRAETVQELVLERTRQLQESRVALQSSEETFRAAMEHASIGMALVEPSGRFIKVNQALCKLLGYGAFELQSKQFQDITHPADLDTDLAFVSQTLAGELESYQMEKRYFHREGHIIWTLLSVSLVRTADGAPRYFVAQIQDITQRKQMDRMKAEFISTVSHELRTPLTSIRGSLGLIAGGVLGPLSEKVASLIRIAHTNSERLVRIINDILDIEKIESGKLELNIRACALAPLLRQSLEANEAYGARLNVRFVLEEAPDDVEVLADHDRFVQVMSNLLSNAAKFSPLGGEVLVRAAKRPAAARIEVQDYGTGIPKEFRSRVFEKFAQADASSARRFEGTGLGLSICRQLVESMGGSIGFTTSMGQGTTFYFQLPRVVGIPAGTRLMDTNLQPILAARGEALTVLEYAKAHRVLYVEDDLDLSNVIGAALSRHVEVVTASTLRAAEQLLREQRFSMVVLDLALPDGSGLSLLEKIDSLPSPPVPVVILSATEASREVQQRVAVALVKSRMSEERTVEIILSVLKLSVWQQGQAAPGNLGSVPETGA